MSFLFNEETSTYRRWVNVLSSLLLPGSGHFLSGRKLAGAIWFFVMQAMQLGVNVAVVTSVVTSTMAVAALFWGAIALRVLMIIDSCRKPISRLKLQIWAGFWVLVIAIPIARMSGARHWLYRPFFIPTAAMQPTLMGNRKSADGQTIKGDHIAVDKFSYHFRTPARGEIVTFRTEGIAESEREKFGIPADQFYVKRIVGLPGERVSIRAADIFINGQKLSDPKVVGHIFVNTNVAPDLLGRMLPEKEVQLGPDEYFLLGDNITNSLDSRYYGGIKREYFLGRVAFIYWPFKRSGAVE
jgi:signal peptidase I